MADHDWPAAAKMFHRLSPRSGGITLALHWGICKLRRHHPERIKWAAELRRRRARIRQAAAAAEGARCGE
jgi:hypothetical protein